MASSSSGFLAEVELRGTTLSWRVNEVRNPVERSAGRPNSRRAYGVNKDVTHDWSEVEVPYNERERISASTSPEVRRAARKPPSKFLRMLTLSGTTTAQVEYATHWRCQVYFRATPPQRPSRTMTRTRPYAFNQVVCRPEVLG